MSSSTVTKVLVMCAYKYNWSLQFFNQDYGPIFSHINVMSINFIHTWVARPQFKVDSKRQIFEKLFMAILFLSHSFCQKCAERKPSKKYCFFHIFILMSDLGFEP